MKNKEQLLYFFLSGKISLSQYDYKFMANLQTMIQNQNRVTSNQADLFDKLISKYKKQLTKHGFDKEELKLLSWKTMLVESTPEYTGAVVSLIDDYIDIRVPFNKIFISEFRNIRNNDFQWISETKTYRTKFSTNGLNIAATTLHKFFNTVRYCDELEPILNEIKQYEGLIWNPTLIDCNGRLIVASVNVVLAELLKDINLSLDSKTVFKLARMGITIDSSLYENNEKIKFAANHTYEVELVDVEQVISWMKNIGCENVLIGRAVRNMINQDKLTNMIEKHGMNALGPMSFGNLLNGVTMMLQNTSPDSRNPYQAILSKTIVIKDSRPIEVQ
jgi:hypothetical protein